MYKVNRQTSQEEYLNAEEEEDQGFYRPSLEEEELIKPTYQEDTFITKHYNQPLANMPKLQVKKLKTQGSDAYIKSKRDYNIEINRQTVLNKINAKSNVFLMKYKPSRMKRHTVLEPLCPSKRKKIGEQLPIKNDSALIHNRIQQHLRTHKGSFLCYRISQPANTYHLFQELDKNGNCFFINHRFNTLLKQRLKKQRLQRFSKSSNKEEEESCLRGNNIKFDGRFQSGNLHYVIKMSDLEYDVYVRHDTNTKGHQGWFYFKISNLAEKRNIKINICNLRRNYKMINEGQSVYIKKGNKNWEYLEGATLITSALNKNNFKVSFFLSLQTKEELYVSLIPPYTYSQLLKQIDSFQLSMHIRVQILTYSLSGLAIPLLTITKDASSNRKQAQTKRKLILISGRIHPSQTCSSYIVSGLVRQLLSSHADNQQFLSNNIIKIVPMMNPDGVVFGNFRTNYLGYDLNRNFHQKDPHVFPEIMALKNICLTYIKEFSKNFVYFIDLHGHSNQKNSFIYGPDVLKDNRNELQSRMFPKILDSQSKYFLYEKCRFRIQQCKVNTARGFVNLKLKIAAFTMETSYALFLQKVKQNSPGENNKPKIMAIQQWMQLGSELIKSINIYSTFIINLVPKHRSTSHESSLKKTEHNDKIQISLPVNIQDLKKQVQVQMAQRSLQKEDHQSNSQQCSDDQSDADSQSQDFSALERSLIMSKIQVKEKEPKIRAMKGSINLPFIITPRIAIERYNNRSHAKIQQFTYRLKGQSAQCRNRGHQLNFQNSKKSILIKKQYALNFKLKN